MICCLGLCCFVKASRSKFAQITIANLLWLRQLSPTYRILGVLKIANLCFKAFPVITTRLNVFGQKINQRVNYPMKWYTMKK